MKKLEEERYREVVGREPITKFPGDPDWEYKGGKAAFEELQKRVGILDDEGEPRKIEGQEELFEEGGAHVADPDPASPLPRRES